MPGSRVCYKDKPATGLNVRLIHTWRRGDIDHAIMSASSGPKDYVRNLVFKIFEDKPGVDEVLMVRGSGHPFFLFRRGNRYLDTSNREVNIESVVELCRSSN